MPLQNRTNGSFRLISAHFDVWPPTFTGREKYKTPSRAHGCLRRAGQREGVQNLVGNAIKYARVGVPPRIVISAEKKGAEYHFAVKDNGFGIDPKNVEHIFAPLKRLHGQEIPGTGIGLAVCKRIVERQGGHIWVSSDPGYGSTFYFTLPA
jgi:signal transduction histidine kinase